MARQSREETMMPKNSLTFLVCLLGMGLTASPALPQSLQNTVLDESSWSDAVPLPRSEPESPRPGLSPSERWGGPWGGDLVLGLPTGFRVEKFLSAEDHSLVVEGLAGLYAIFPMVGGGVRWHGITLGGKADCLCASPGVDGYLLYNTLSHSGFWFSGGPSTFGLAGFDMDAAWRHRYGDRLLGKLGLKLGAGIAFAHGSEIVPLGALYGGFRY
jgi:hypothetical protein